MCYPVLYSFRRCPYAMRARLAILAANYPVQLREVVLKSKPPQLVELSAKATVPVLQLRDTVIDESLDIMLFVLQQQDPHCWLQQQSQSLALIKLNDAQFKPQLDRYKYFERYPEQSQVQYRQQALWFLDELEARLQQQRFLLGDQCRLADMAILPFIRQFAVVDAKWFASSGYPKLQQWLQQGLDQPLFIACMQKIAPWQAQLDNHVVFGK